MIPYEQSKYLSMSLSLRDSVVLHKHRERDPAINRGLGEGIAPSASFVGIMNLSPSYIVFAENLRAELSA